MIQHITLGIIDKVLGITDYIERPFNLSVPWSSEHISQYASLPPGAVVAGGGAVCMYIGSKFEENIQGHANAIGSSED